VKAFWDLNRSRGLMFSLVYGVSAFLEEDWPGASRALLRFLMRSHPEHFGVRVRYAGMMMRNGDTESAGACYVGALKGWSRIRTRVSPVRQPGFVETIRGLQSPAEIEACFVSTPPETVEALHIGLELMARFGLVDALESVPDRNRSLLRGSPASIGVLNVRDIREDPAEQLQELFPARPYAFREPPVFGELDIRPKRAIEAPACWLGCVRDVKVMGGLPWFATMS
jgi:hypothetical protein